MVFAITNRCDQCNTCAPLCPVDAIQQGEDAYWIDPTLCNNCEGYADQPICRVSCPIDAPIPWQAKKGRHKADVRSVTSPDLFTNAKHHPFASAIVVWELCNVLSQRQSLPWQQQESGVFSYQRPIKQTLGHLSFQVTYSPTEFA
jgi:Fe-S-cluster-containing hydrogenase component 2